ncbi:MAG TPA: TetR/AcrR family transcriptional regulator [Caulobacteraceae bacterium]
MTEQFASGVKPTISRREAGKAERRERIIHAARALIRETGNAGLSMRALAARAGVSLATPYNLFGSKRAIVLALLQDVRAFHEQFATLRSADPLHKLFAAVDMAIDFYVSDPRFYKTLWAAVFDTSDEVRHEIYNPKRDAFWQGLIRDAAEVGAIAADINLDQLLHQLDFQFRSVMLEWVVGEMEPEILSPTIGLGYALILKGAASPDWRGPLHARIVEGQAVLDRLAIELKAAAHPQN